MSASSTEKSLKYLAMSNAVSPMSASSTEESESKVSEQPASHCHSLYCANFEMGAQQVSEDTRLMKVRMEVKGTLRRLYAMRALMASMYGTHD